MRKTFAAAATALSLAAAPAFAADMPMKAAPMPAAVWSWTGFYIGAHVGAGWGETESTITGFTAAVPGVPALTANTNLPFNQNSRSGFLGGGQAGYNWQAGVFVIGVQGDISGLDVKGTDPCLVVLSCTAKSNWLATATGRLGAVVLDRGLVYAKGGGAWLNTNNSVNLTLATPPLAITNGSFTQSGWLVGMGTEWMITQNWTAFVEYDYMRFDDKSVAFNVNPVLVAPATVSIRTNQTNTLSVAKVGVNYKFGWGGPVAAKY